MKKNLPYLIGGAVLLLLVIVLLASRGKPMHRFDERITLRQRDKIPYGTAVARSLLPSLFPKANIKVDAAYPGAWDAINSYGSSQAVILIADYFNADTEELDRLSRFVSNGNDVLIVARSFSDEAEHFFNLATTPYYHFLSEGADDSLRVRLLPPAYSTDSFFVYPGKRYDGSLQKFDTARTAVLGSNDAGHVNYIRLQKGTGHFFIHTAPLTFSNYFILHKNNVAYYQHIFSALPKNMETVVWNEYYLEKVQDPAQDKDVNWLGALLKVPAFRWGFLTALATLILFLLLGMRRSQRQIPPHKKPKNDSLDFVKTLGRLYYDQGDHANLARKMSVYFLEHVRSTYKIATHTLDDDFVKALHFKSGYPEPEIKKLVDQIQSLSDEHSTGEEQLASFHKQLELFYQTT